MVKKVRINSPFLTFCFLFLNLLFISTSVYPQKTTIIAKKITDSQKLYEVKASYLQMEVPKDVLMGVRGMMADFNTPIEDLVTFRVNEFKASVDPNNSSGTGKSFLVITPDITSDTKNIFSVKFEFFTEKEHEAHPNSVFGSYNFSYDSWLPFELKNMFDTTSSYLAAISEFCRKDLKKQFNELNKEMSVDLNKGTEPTAENYRIFNLSGDRLLITFQYYQLGPRTLGAPVVSMPLTNLKEMINPAGPLGYYIKK